MDEWNNSSLMDASDGISEATSVSTMMYLCDYCKVIAVLLYSCLSLVAFIGNSLILAVFFYFRRLRTPTNMLIANLAVADLMISVFCIPLSYWHVIIFEDQRWIFGSAMCRLFNYLQATAVFLSSWTLVAISFDRFMAIMFVMSPWLRINKKRACCMITATWIFSLFMALPLLIVNQIENSASNVDVETCLEKWESLSGILGDEESTVHTYTSLVFLLQYCLPLAVLLLTYTCIGLRMWNSKVPGESGQRSAQLPSKQNGTHAHHQPQLDRRHESVKKLIPMVLLVSALYAGCWLPQNLLMNIWVTYDPSILSHPFILYIWWGSHTLAMFHSIVNPFIYYTQNKRIHEAVNYLLQFLPCVPVQSRLGFTTDVDRALSQKRGASAANSMRNIRFVNMVAYMPVTGGKKIIHPTMSLST
ncbi:7 transmembrane receptor (rhodopsin family) domain-containing protein [Ditylenchus destructor]|nr:7 transmembrane receptor (rhodopsin family) domain-containing protein [Ditylenchus destructor]